MLCWHVAWLVANTRYDMDTGKKKRNTRVGRGTLELAFRNTRVGH